jgi:ribosomal protein S27E
MTKSSLFILPENSTFVVYGFLRAGHFRCVMCGNEIELSEGQEGKLYTSIAEVRDSSNG